MIDPTLTHPDTRVASDSAFPVSGPLFGKIITPLKKGELARVDPVLRFVTLQMSAACTSIRQAAEWGMGSVEKVWRILLLKLPFNPALRQLRLENIHRLHNVRVRLTGISQIRTVFGGKHQNI